MDIKHGGYIVLTFTFKQEGKNWNAYCEELGTATFARNPVTAAKRLHELVELHLNTLEKVGERERFFKKNNIKLHANIPKKGRMPEPKEPLPPVGSYFVAPYIRPIKEEFVPA